MLCVVTAGGATGVMHFPAQPVTGVLHVAAVHCSAVQEAKIRMHVRADNASDIRQNVTGDQ